MDQHGKMDLTIWKQTIVNWINCLEPPLIINSSQEIGDSIVEEILSILIPNHGKSVDAFMKDIFPCYTPLTAPTDFDYLCMCTLILIFVCFSSKNEFDLIRQKMCVKLENSVQEYMTDFLTSIQNYEDVFKINQKTIREEILKFSKRHNFKNSTYSDTNCTPARKRLNISAGLESPLLEFFQTPTEKFNRNRSSISPYCDIVQQNKIKKLTDELTEAELERLSLEEDLKILKTRFNENETRLKSKTEELKQLQENWEREADSHERRVRMLSLTIIKNLEDKKKVGDKITSLENYISSLQEELSHMTTEKHNLKDQLNSALNKIERNKEDIRNLSNVSTELENSLRRIEGEVLALREHVAHATESELKSNYWDDYFDSTPAHNSRKRNTKNLLEENIVLGGTLKNHKRERCRIKLLFSRLHCFRRIISNR